MRTRSTSPWIKGPLSREQWRWLAFQLAHQIVVNLADCRFVRGEPVDRVEFLKSRLAITLRPEQTPEVVVRLGVVRLEAKRGAVFGDGPVQIALRLELGAEDAMPYGVVRADDGIRANLPGGVCR